MAATVDPEGQLLATVLRRSFMVVETNARRLCHKNVKAIWLVTEELKREAMAKVAAKVKAARIAKANERAAPTRSLASPTAPTALAPTTTTTLPPPPPTQTQS